MTLDSDLFFGGGIHLHHVIT